MIKIVPGHYAQNHIKYLCLDCGEEFIVGKETSDAHGKKLHCPYCSSNNTHWSSYTTDEILVEHKDEGMLGCSWIYKSVEEEGR